MSEGANKFEKSISTVPAYSILSRRTVGEDGVRLPYPAKKNKKIKIILKRISVTYSHFYTFKHMKMEKRWALLAPKKS
jgi:hypothetical protein